MSKLVTSSLLRGSRSFVGIFSREPPGGGDEGHVPLRSAHTPMENLIQALDKDKGL